LDKPVVIVNPRSGGGLSESRWARLAGPITEGLGPFDVRFTASARDATRLARDAAVEGRALVVALGGDGTVNEVAEGLLEAGGSTELGIIPRGTGGDFRRSLALPDDVRDAAARVRAASPRRIDVGRASFQSAGGDRVTRHFVNVASFGFSADVARRANASSKRLGGKVSFLGATLRSLAGFDNFEAFVSIDGGEPRRRTLLFGAVGGGRFFGGGMKICPEAKLDDGLFDVVLVGDYGHFEVLTKVHRLYDGTHLTLPDVHGVCAKRVEVTPADGGAAVPVEVDGETPGTLPATFEVVPAALTLRA
jgi:YegS/Rv2252/BmrU family lipid kinase